MAEPPVLVPVMVNIVRVNKTVGVPVIVPVEVENARPVGKLGLAGSRAQDTMTPEPMMVGESGRSLLAVLLTMLKSFGE